jgi:hypothetical protein
MACDHRCGFVQLPLLATTYSTTKRKHDIDLRIIQNGRNDEVQCCRSAGLAR